MVRKCSPLLPVITCRTADVFSSFSLSGRFHREQKSPPYRNVAVFDDISRVSVSAVKLVRG